MQTEPAGGAEAPRAALDFRDATRDDTDRLVALENAAFTTDRLSRRSFRGLIDSPKARLRIALSDGRLAGYALTLWRSGTGVARLYSIATDAAFRRTGAGAALLADAERGATALGLAVLRLEVAADNDAAIALYRRAGYRTLARLPRYYEDGGDALRMEKPLRDGGAPADAPAYYAQTTDFTCGAACLMMALRARDPAQPFDAVTEVRLWRAATTVFMTSGLGGCEPWGLAVTLAEHGLPAEIWTTEAGPLMLRTVQNAEKRRVMALAQEDFRGRAATLGLPVHVGALPVARLEEMLRAGAIAILLISGNRMFGVQVPHWVLAWGADDAHVFIHDPWVDEDAFETQTDAQSIPVPRAELDRMWRWGADRLRAAVLVPPPGGTPHADGQPRTGGPRRPGDPR